MNSWTYFCGKSPVRDYSRGPVKVVLVTDVFPPRSGGSGWSTYYLGKALAERGHAVRVVRPVYGTGVIRSSHKKSSYGGLAVDELHVPSPPGWAVRVGLGKAWEEQRAVRIIRAWCRRLAGTGVADVLHGQHQVSGTAAALSAEAARKQGRRVISVVTVRDYWPLCPSSTRLFPARQGKSAECTECHNFTSYVSCVSRTGIPGPVQILGAARWMRTRLQARELARADAVIPVSNYVQSELARSGRFDRGNLHLIHNLVDLASVDKVLAQPNVNNPPVDGPYLLFAGKLDENKGAQLLPEAIQASDIRLPLLLTGDGPSQSRLQSEAQSRGLDFQFLGWQDNDTLIRLMHNARCLVFPSCWQEPLSRVLLEGCAAGAAIVALDTGGTSDVLTHNVSGWLARDLASFAEGVRQVCSDDTLNGSLRRGAREVAATRFSAHMVARQVEDLYISLLARIGGE